jgi:hypothetical protein
MRLPNTHKHKRSQLEEEEEENNNNNNNKKTLKENQKSGRHFSTDANECSAATAPHSD